MDKITLNRCDREDRVELDVVDDAPKISAAYWKKICETREQLAAADVDLSSWNRRFPLFSKLAMITFAAQAIMVRIGLYSESLRLTSLGFKVGFVGLLLLGYGAGRQQAAVKNVKKSSELLEKQVKKKLGSKVQPPVSRLDLSRVQEIYRQNLTECPWILRYCTNAEVSPTLDSRVRTGTTGLFYHRRQKAMAHSRSRTTILLASGCGIATALSLAKSVGVGWGLSAGIGIGLMAMASAVHFHAQYSEVKLRVSGQESLLNHATDHSTSLRDEFAPWVTELQRLEGNRLNTFPRLRKVALSSLERNQTFPPSLRELTLEEDRLTISSLPSRLKKLTARSYTPIEPEPLNFPDLKEADFQFVSSSGLSRLDTLFRLNKLTVAQLPTLDHPIFRRIKELSTDTIPIEEEKRQSIVSRVAIKRLELRRPTPRCLENITHLGTIQEITLHQDPGVELKTLKAMFNGNVTRLKIKGWTNKAAWPEKKIKKLWRGHYDFYLDGEILNDEQKLAKLFSPRTENNCELIIRWPA